MKTETACEYEKAKTSAATPYCISLDKGEHPPYRETQHHQQPTRFLASPHLPALPRLILTREGSEDLEGATSTRTVAELQAGGAERDEID